MFWAAYRKICSTPIQSTQKIIKGYGGSAEHNILEAIYEQTRSHLRKRHTSSPTNAKLRVIPYTCYILLVSQGNYSLSIPYTCYILLVSQGNYSLSNEV